MSQAAQWFSCRFLFMWKPAVTSIILELQPHASAASTRATWQARAFSVDNRILFARRYITLSLNSDGATCLTALQRCIFRIQGARCRAFGGHASRIQWLVEGSWGKCIGVHSLVIHRHPHLISYSLGCLRDIVSRVFWHTSDRCYFQH